MVDVGGLIRRFGTIIVQYLRVADLLHNVNVSNRPLACERQMDIIVHLTCLESLTDTKHQIIPVLTKFKMASCGTKEVDISHDTVIAFNDHVDPSAKEYICSVPIMLCHAPPLQDKITQMSDGEMTSRTVKVLMIVYAIDYT